MEHQKSTITFPKLQKCIAHAAKITTIQSNINNKISQTPLESLSHLENFTSHKNFTDLIEFYKNILEIDDSLRKTNFKLKSKVYSVGHIQENKIVEKIEVFWETLSKLDQYDGILVAEDLKNTYLMDFKTNLDALKMSFFHSLKKFAPEMENGVKPLAIFIRKNLNRLEFEEEYVKTFFNKFKMSEEPKTNEVIEKINDWKIPKIKRSTLEIFGDDSEPLVKVIEGLLLVDAKIKVSKMLLNIEKKNKPDDIVVCIAIYEGTSKIKGFSELVEEIIKLSSNLLLTLYSKIGVAQAPNKYCDAESFVASAAVICKGTQKNVSFTNDVRKISDFIEKGCGLGVILGSKLYNKIHELAQSLNGIKKCVYLINNLFLISSFYEFHENSLIRSECADQCDALCGVWETELNKRSNRDLTSFIDTNLLVQKSYLLPDGYRNDAVKRISSLIEKFSANNLYSNKKEVLKEYLDNLFTGR